MRRPFSSGYSNTPADSGATRTFSTGRLRLSSAASQRSSVERICSTISNSSSSTGSSPVSEVSSSVTLSTRRAVAETTTSLAGPPATSSRNTRNLRSAGASTGVPRAGSTRPRYAMRAVSGKCPASSRTSRTTRISSGLCRAYGLVVSCDMVDPLVVPTPRRAVTRGVCPGSLFVLRL